MKAKGLVVKLHSFSSLWSAGGLSDADFKKMQESESPLQDLCCTVAKGSNALIGLFLKFLATMEYDLFELLLSTKCNLRSYTSSLDESVEKFVYCEKLIEVAQCFRYHAECEKLAVFLHLHDAEHVVPQLRDVNPMLKPDWCAWKILTMWRTQYGKRAFPYTLYTALVERLQMHNAAKKLKPFLNKFEAGQKHAPPPY